MNTLITTKIHITHTKKMTIHQTTSQKLGLSQQSYCELTFCNDARRSFVYRRQDDPLPPLAGG